MLPLLAAIPASASILSATGQSVGTRSPNSEYLRVTTVQSELNTTMREMNDEVAAVAGVDAEAPAVEGGAYVLQKDGTGGNSGTNTKFENVFTPGDSHESGRISINTRDGSVHTRPSRFDGNNRGGGGRDHRNDPHAAPEPSTWMLLGTGLAMIGGYVMIRRRAALET
jgi:hypothetical protein